MSVRRRNIQSRLARDLRIEQGNHQLTRGLYDAQALVSKKAIEETDRLRSALHRIAAMAEHGTELHDIHEVAARALAGLPEPQEAKHE